MPDEYETGLSRIVEDNLPEQHARARQLITATAEMMKHFFDNAPYGIAEECTPDTIGGYWPYVRYLVYDRLRPKFGQDHALFASVQWDDKFLQELADESKQLEEIVPTDLQNNEWRFMVSIAAYMIMQNPFFVREGYISAEGRQGLIMQSLMAWNGQEDKYEKQFLAWNEQWGKKSE